MKRKVLSVILTGAMVAGLAGTVTVHAEEQKTYNIGICQLVQHEALDAATQGFEDAVKEARKKKLFVARDIFGINLSSAS